MFGGTGKSDLCYALLTPFIVWESVMSFPRQLSLKEQTTMITCLSSSCPGNIVTGGPYSPFSSQFVA